ncbi:malectin domain-containing carbohydrate-binding protein [Flaviaesturariibacter amylovorans]|uniref:PKD/Chitinase domain-containing protein n=1 Tax=Flaviaesturariibacter amylovorans TaxID=1084520 RepID=A0ABP8HN05_9BACT
MSRLRPAKSIGILNVFSVVILVFLSITAEAQISFTSSALKLNGTTVYNPTSIQFGPDKRLYVAEQAGWIRIYTVKKNGANDYSVTGFETINVVNQIPNHNDDGTLNTSITKRQVTGIVLRGTATNPVIYVSSSDSRIGGPSGETNLDTNSGMISMLTWDGTKWVKIDLVRGLPRSEENHSVNGMQLDDVTNTLFVAVGGFTNAGAPSTNFAYTTEYALSAAIVSIDLNAIMALPTKGTGNTAYKYDLPTLDDPTRANQADGTDVGDPFGGNDGLNQAVVVAGGPVQVFASGIRNAYDLLITKSRKMYTVDNGANQGWGGYPDKEGTTNVTNNYIAGEPGSTTATANHPQVNNLDNFHYVGDLNTYVRGSFYGGHPNPVRANPAGAGLYTHNGSVGVFRTSTTGTNPLPANWPPVPVSMADPKEAFYKMPGNADGALLTFKSSTNGITEYTASTFGGALKGHLLVAEYNGAIGLIKLTADGTNTTNAKDPVNKMNKEPDFASNFGATPLDLIAQGDNDPFPGTVWVLTYGANAITVFEPQQNGACTGADNTSDEDGDGYTNSDELANGTNPCSGSSKPADFDGDNLSDLADTDDDNDGINDNLDAFAIDATNGRGTSMPITYNLFNNDPGKGFFGLGFTGLMSNSDSDYLKLFDKDDLIAGGAVGAFSVVDVPAGDALGTLNTQKNAFQFGVQTAGLPFTFKGRILGPFFNNQTPSGSQSLGVFIGSGDQDNYLKIVLNANGGAGGIQVVYENAGVATTQQYPIAGGIPGSTLDLILTYDAATGSVQAAYASNSGAVINVGAPIAVSGAVLHALKGNTTLAVGVIATSKGGAPFTATWDYLYMNADAITSSGTWQTVAPASGTFTGREENAYVQAGDKFYLMGGRGNKPVQEYNPVTKAWVNKAYQPLELHHFQAVTLDGLVYVVGAFTGAYPRETPVPNVYMFNPAANQWITGRSIPEARRRGAGGTVVHNGKIYLVGGITDGHWAGWVKWFDVYDPATNSWTTLPDAPRARDHAQATIANGKLYFAGGRRSSASTNQDFELAVPEVDVYDFATGTWSTLPASANIPTPRSGASNVTIGNEVIVIGGESASQLAAHAETEALDVTTNTWRRLADLQTGRHGTQAIANNGGIFTTTGAGNRGGTPILTTQEAFYFFGPTSPEGVAITAGALAAPGTLNFGTTGINVSTTKTLLLSNTSGNQAINVSTIIVSGASSFTFTSPHPLPFVIAPGQSVSISVTFKPVSAGSQTANLIVENSGQGGSVTTVLNGVGNAVAYRINAGGASVTNSIGTFGSDNFFYPAPGTTKSTTAAIAGTTDDAMYQNERNGTSLSYDFAVNNGQYKVVLHFAEITHSAAGSRLFDVSIEGAKKLDNYDIVAKAGAAFTARVETFTVSVTDGTLNVNFSSLAADGGKDLASIAAIEIVSATVANEPPIGDAGPDKSITLPTNTTVLNGSGSDAGGSIAAYTWTQVSGPGIATFSSRYVAAPTLSGLQYGIYVFSLVVTDNQGATSAPDQVTVVVNGAPGTSSGQSTVRINAGGQQLNTSMGTFSADNHHTASLGINSSTAPIEGTTDDALYQTYRWGYLFDYKIPVNNGQYKVVLHFAETNFTAAGSRKFDVEIEGVLKLDNYDIFAKVGGKTATTETFTVIVGDGSLDINFNSKAFHGGNNNALICGIEIMPATASGNAAPVANAGPNKTITLPTSTVVLNGSGTDSDGSIAAYSWSQVSGPGTATFSNKAVAAPTVSGLAQGTYVFALVVTDNAAASSSASQVTVTVNGAAAANQPPVANAGADKTITLPANSTVLNGSGTDTDGTMTTYSWSQVSGPGAAAFSSSTVAAPTVSGLVQGTYVFSLLVTDNAGATSVPDEVVVTVNAAPTPGPATAVLRINSGGAQVTNSIGTFAADQSFSPNPGNRNSSTAAINGTTDDEIYQSERWGSTFNYNFPIANGEYRVVLHFAEFTYATVGRRVFDVTMEGVKRLDNYDIFAKAGAFTAITESFTVNVTDGVLNINFSSLAADGGKTYAKVSAIEVLRAGAPNAAPVANAGPDHSLTLPTSSVVLNGSGTDNDGTITTYTWSQVSGPNTATFSSNAVAAPTVSGLVQGSYTFQLVVTDNAGAQSVADGVTVTVNGAPASTQAVSTFTLINADTDQDLFTIADGATLDLATLPTRNLNIRANTSPATVGSVRFVLSGAQARTVTESGAPYALFGDNAGNYNPWTPVLGAYTLQGTPYTGSGATGTAGTVLTVRFNVVNNPPMVTSRGRGGAQASKETVAVPGEQELKIYPNPTSGRLALRFSEAVSEDVTYLLYGPAGNRIGSGVQPLGKPAAEVAIDLSRHNLANGVYYLEVKSGQWRKTVRVMIAGR